MNRQRIQQLVEHYDLPAFRGRQIAQAFLREYRETFLEITTLPKRLREELHANEKVSTFRQVRTFASRNRNAWKALMTLEDGAVIESVMMSPKEGLWSVCVSVQSGCRLGCTFCSTGAMKYRRDLTAEEITDQILFWKQFARKESGGQWTPRNIVFMGMGEPLDNSHALLAALDELTAADGFAIGARHICVSTAGVVPEIPVLIERYPQINLSISLHAPTNELRNTLMPINRRYPLEELQQTLIQVLNQTNRRISFEYVMLAEVNDHWETMQELGEWLAGFPQRQLIHVNLIPYHSGSSKQRYRASSKQRIQQCRDFLRQHGFQTTIRKSIATDIGGACGQLAGTHPGNPRRH